ncbi:hypothetical protein LNKW23_44250 [Paralimibaculum aggregatum]|uniref:Uncharacterized protein n=1 Tax=Paralimibaculum aggregatum TaxID=3036245 RepID=A0ABQ6LSZ5_9RHOB|nr:hypothetical protein LNKW23_44250 [Limibaculum sp. NKW23]
MACTRFDRPGRRPHPAGHRLAPGQSAFGTLEETGTGPGDSGPLAIRDGVAADGNPAAGLGDAAPRAVLTVPISPRLLGGTGMPEPFGRSFTPDAGSFDHFGGGAEHGPTFTLPATDARGLAGARDIAVPIVGNRPPEIVTAARLETGGTDLPIAAGPGALAIRDHDGIERTAVDIGPTAFTGDPSGTGTEGVLPGPFDPAPEAFGDLALGDRIDPIHSLVAQDAFGVRHPRDPRHHQRHR